LLQRTKREKCILWCPLELPFYNTNNNNTINNNHHQITSLPQLLEQYCSKQPYTSIAPTPKNNKKKKKNKDYYDFDKQPFDFEVQIPSFGGVTEQNTDLNKWSTTRSFQFTTLTAFLFLGIQRQPKADNVDNDTEDDNQNFNHTELVIPAILDVSKLCDPSAIPKSVNKEYELVGGVLFDEGDYVPVLRDEGRLAMATAAKSTTDNQKKKENSPQDDNEDDDEEEEDEEAWKLLETEEVIPMSQSDVLEFLKGDNEAEGEAPCGTIAIYKRKDKACHDEMNQLLSDIIISQVSGTLNSNADFYIEEEIIEDEYDDDEDDDEEDDDDDDDGKIGMATIQE